MGMKAGLWIGLLMLLILTACMADGQGRQPVDENDEQLRQDHESVTDQTADEFGTADESVTDQTADEFSPMFSHIHGLAYGLNEPYDLYVSTNDGLIQITASNEWQWTADPHHRHDLVSFKVQDTDTLIASGHPAEQSDLQEPLGIVVSKNQGATWEPVALHGEVHFQVLDMNAGDPSILYGLADQEFAFYQSINGGLSWEKIKTERLSPDTHALVSDPGRPESLLAGTPKGILTSDDGGKTWEMFNPNLTFVGIQALPSQPSLIVAYLLGDMEGLMMSEDFGQTWSSLNFTIENDVVSAIAVHPEEANTFAVGTLEASIYLTKDGGEQWIQLAESGRPIE